MDEKIYNRKYNYENCNNVEIKDLTIETDNGIIKICHGKVMDFYL